MRIEAIEVEGFGPFCARQCVRLSERGLVAVMGINDDEPRMDSNGAGKSSLIDALDWGLFGVPPRGDGVDAIVNTQAAAEGAPARVVVRASDEGTPLVIERTRYHGGPTALALTYDGDDASALDTAETQKHIEWHLGLCRQVFRSAVLFAQTDLMRFCDATDAERMAILTRILGLDALDHWLVRARVLHGVAKEAEAETRRVHDRLETERGTLASVDYVDLSRAFAAETKAMLDEVARRGEALDRALKATVARRDQALKALRALTLPPLPNDDVIAAMVEDRKSALAQRDEVRGAHMRQLAEATRLGRLMSLGPRCPTCERPVDAGHLATVQRALSETQRACAPLEERSKSWQAYIDQIDQAIAETRASQRAALDARASALAEQADLRRSLAHGDTDLVQHQAAIADLTASRMRIEARCDPAVAARAQTDQRIASLRQEIGKVRLALNANTALCERYAWWIKALGPQGLRSYVLESRLGEMTDAANAYCQVLTGGTFWLRLEAQATLRSGATRNKFAVRVMTRGPDGAACERPYRSLSGGQKQRISLAVDFGLSRLVARRAKKTYGLLILDEVFRHLDARGRDAVMEMLVQMRGEKETILVVDHDAEFQSMFEQRLTVRMTGGQARVEE